METSGKRRPAMKTNSQYQPSSLPKRIMEQMSFNINREKLDDEILNGDLDLDLDEALELYTARSRTSRSRISQPTTFTDISSATTHPEQSMPVKCDDLLRELDSISASAELIAPEPPLFSVQIIFQENAFGAGFFAQPKFCNKLRKEINKNYAVESTITKGTDKSQLQKLIYIIDLKSKNQDNVNVAQQSLKLLFDTVSTKHFDDQLGFAAKHPQCTSIVQAYGDQNEHLFILCEYETIGLIIYYFDEGKSSVFLNLCTTPTTLEKIIKEKFLSIDIPLSSTSDLTTNTEKSHFAENIRKLEKQIRPETSLIFIEQRRIRLFGFIEIIKELKKQIEEIKTQYASNTVKLLLEPQQIKYILDVYHEELKSLEVRYPGAEILDHLKNGEFLAPQFSHTNIENEIVVLATLCTPVQFEIEEEAFRTIALNERPNLITIGRQYKCQIEIQEITTKHICQIPKATTHDHISNKLTAAAIKIHKQDLAEQRVDLVVICSTSMYLRDGILQKAGPAVKQEYIEAAKTSPSEPFETNAGQLQCRKLLFLPWEVNQGNKEAFCLSIRNFVSRAVQHAVKAHHTSIAFPSIGCGKLNIDKNVIANEMLVEAQNQLLSANVLLQIIFVILPEQENVFDAFQMKLESLQKGNVEKNDTEIAYFLSTLKMTIISSNTQKQEECKKALNDYVQKSILVCELLQQDVLKKWTQPAIDKLYKYCLDRHVIPDMDITIGYFKLSGPKEAVREAEIEYLREQAKQSEQARLVAIARNIIWAHKVNDGNSEKYSPELNARIEDAFSSKVPSFIFVDDKSVEYSIDFKTMTETCVTNQQQRGVIRQADFDMPPHWDVQSGNVAQFPVPVNSSEYNEVLALFDKTMANKYTQILRIDRIQNKPWYMQYNSYKSFSSKKDTEKRLFHGCPQQSSMLIINSFFNRSFAGINGVVYGQGAYFSANAVYSHTYAHANTPNGERHMFVVNVLVGDSIHGNSKMKTPPAGFESTTDGQHIFVTYRDDQAYATHLIVYK